MRASIPCTCSSPGVSFEGAARHGIKPSMSCAGRTTLRRSFGCRDGMGLRRSNEQGLQLKKPSLYALNTSVETSTVTDLAGEGARLHPSALPPTGAKVTDLISVADGLWALRQDFPSSGSGLNFNLNGVVAQLEDGSLLIYGAVAPTKECLQHISTLPGEVRHIVAGTLSVEHWYHTGAMGECFPEATLWLCPGLMEGEGVSSAGGGSITVPTFKEALDRIKATGRAKTFSREAPWMNEVDYIMFEDAKGSFREATFYLKRHRAILMEDLAFGAFCDEGMGNVFSRLLGQVAGVYKRLGCPAAWPVMLQDKERARTWYQQVMAWDFDIICGGHLTPAIYDARKEMERCFRFLSA